MTFFVSTAMGFITSNKIDPEFPKRCIDQSRSKDVRWAYPFSSWDEANRFAVRLTTSPNWPPSSRYYAIMTSASPNIREEEPPASPIEPPVTTTVRQGIAERLRAMLA
jgi:hypothetical protein